MYINNEKFRGVYRKSVILFSMYFVLAIMRAVKLLFLGSTGGVAEGSSVDISGYQAVIERESIENLATVNSSSKCKEVLKFRGMLTKVNTSHEEA